MRLTTWNVNGIRNPFSYPPWNVNRTFPAMFDILGSDIVVMQELKIQRKDLRDDMVLIDGWDCYFSLPKHKKGYSGVGIYTRNATCAAIRAEEGLLGVLPSPNGTAYCDLPEDQSIGGYPDTLQLAELGVDAALLDGEGRCVAVEFPAFVLFGVYSPANSNGLRDDFRYGFICALDCRIRNLIKMGKRVVLVGDLNVSSCEVDSAGSVDECKKEGISHTQYISTPNRRIFNQLLIGGDVAGERDEGRERGVLWDTSRGFHPDRTGMYTHWETKINARPGNFGSRIDYVLVSESMQPWIKDANIQEGLQGSDHCPVFADFHDEVQDGTVQKHLLDIINPPGTFDGGVRRIDWSLQRTPPFSARRMPEFDKRRTIKSMFAAPRPKNQPSQTETSIETPNTPNASATVTPGEKGSQERDGRVPATGATATSPSIPAAIASPKRKLTSTTAQNATKRVKAGSQPPGLKGQQSLKGFFVRSASNSSGTKGVDVQEMDASNTDKLPGDTVRSPSQSQGAQHKTEHDTSYRPSTPTESDTAPNGTQLSETSPSLSLSSMSAKIAAAEESQKSWGALFSRPTAPLCEEHQEPCKTMLTKKKGSNQGRSFWMCARPLGPSGDKERGTEWRCPTFIWCSDWQPRKGE